MSNKRPETHVAQQFRRDKLRIQNSPQHLEDFPNDLEQLSLHPGFNSDLLQVRSVRNANMLYEPAFYSSEMLNFSTASNPFSEPTSRLMMPQLASVFPHSSDTASLSIHSSPDQQCQVRDLGNWRNSGSHQGCDWMLNYASSSAANQSNPNPNSFFVAEVNNELTGVQSSLNNAAGETATPESHRQVGEIHQNTMQDIIKSASINGQASEMTSLMQQTGHGIWVENGNQLVFLPNYVNLSNQFRFGNPSSWTSRTGDNSLRCKKSDERMGLLVSDSNNQGLSLSLSSNAQSAPCGSDEPQSRHVVSKDPQFSKSLKSVNTSFISGDCGKSLQNMVVGIPSNNIGYRNVGPLGPFTGYSTILKSSNFLEPAKQLLDEICGRSIQKLTKSCDVSGKVSGEVGAFTSAGAVIPATESGGCAKRSNSVASSSVFHSSDGNENCGDGGAGSSSRLSSRPENQQRMAKFLYMQEEVIRRYKQHRQQMQMVVSSFESVAGLSSATPYISKALKSVSRHFRCLENAISDQLKHIREVLAEELSGPTTGTPTSNKLDSNMARLRFMDQSFHKNKIIMGSTGFLEHQQHAWRPQQKGLPERAVAILRAWLFEHFLHPYPTDADKHMLAARTGLSRNQVLRIERQATQERNCHLKRNYSSDSLIPSNVNLVFQAVQVSNWFINARVRVWKPMVEEIHMLETKGLTGENENQNPIKNEGTSAIEGASESRVDQPLSNSEFQCLEIGSVDSNVEEVEELHAEQWTQEKRSKLECPITSSMNGTLLGFVPYRRGEVEVGGAGSVSLTLGLRHGVEGVQPQQQQQLLEQQQQQLRRHFGGQMINDFVG